MKKLTTFFTLAAACCISAFAQLQSEGAAGTTSQTADKGTMRQYELNLGDFDKVEVVDGIEVELHCLADSAGRIFFETTHDVASGLLFSNNNKGKLTIEKQFHDEGQLVYNLPTVHVFTRFLTEVTNAGDSTVRVTGPRPTAKFNAILIGNGKLIVRDLECNQVDGSIRTGNGTLVLSGKTRDVSLSNTGVGTILADGLEAQNASCKFFGKGTTGVWATDKLTIKGMFPGKLYYKGTPKKMKNYGMGVKVIRMTDGLEPDPDTPEYQ